MQSKDYFKLKAKKLARQTWAGPGKFGVFIIICIIIIATFESLGLSNREKNLEIRSVPLVAINLNLKDIHEGNDITNTKEVARLAKDIPLKEIDNKNKLRFSLLYHGAIDQYLYEHSSTLNSDNYNKNIEKIIPTQFNQNNLELKDQSSYSASINMNSNYYEVYVQNSDSKNETNIDDYNLFGI